eukprot:gene10380-11296_t
MGNKNAGGYLQDVEAFGKRDEGKGKVDDSVLKRKEVTSHDPHPISKPQSKLVPSSSQSSVLAESFQKESKSNVSNPNAETSIPHGTISTHHAVKENEVDSPVKKAEIDKSLVMQYLGEKSCVDSNADKSNKAIILELFENHRNAKAALTSSTVVSSHSREGSDNGTVNEKNPHNLKSSAAIEEKESHLDNGLPESQSLHNTSSVKSTVAEQTEATITEPSSVTKETQEQSTKESGLVTNQTEPTNSGTKEIADAIDKRDDSKAVLVGEQIEKKENGQ